MFSIVLYVITHYKAFIQPPEVNQFHAQSISSEDQDAARGCHLRL